MVSKLISTQVLKYKILEYCVNAIFDGIHKNLFSKCVNKSVDPRDLVEGMVLSRIYSSRWGIERNKGNSPFLNCMIYSIIPKGGKYIKISFSYTRLMTNYVNEGPGSGVIEINVVDRDDYWVFIL